MAIFCWDTDAPSVYACVDRARNAYLFVTLEDEALREPPHEDPLLRVVIRYPKVLILANCPATEGGVPVVDWVRGLAGYADNFGIARTMRGDSSMELTHAGARAIATFDETGQGAHRFKIDYVSGSPLRHMNWTLRSPHRWGRPSVQIIWSPARRRWSVDPAVVGAY